MATKKTPPRAKGKATTAKKPAVKPKPHIVKTAATPKPASAPSAAKKRDPVILSAPKQPASPVKKAPADIIDAEVIDRPKKAAHPDPIIKPAVTPAPKPPADKPGSGSLVKAAALVAAALVVSAVIALGLDRLSQPAANTDSSTAAIKLLQTSTDSQYSELKNSVANLGKGLAAVQSALDGLQTSTNAPDSDINAQVAQAVESVAQLATRLTAAEDALATPATIEISSNNDETAALITQYDQTVQALRQQLDTQAAANAELAKRLNDIETTQDDLATANTQIVNLTTAAQHNTAGADMALALGNLTAAIESGATYPAQIARIEELSGTKITGVIANHANTGVTPLHQLQSSFPDAARLALKASLLAGAGDSMLSKFTAFVKSQISVRSLEERTGDDPDAVLSRAESALAQGQLAAAVSLVRQLPTKGVLAMEDWLAKADSRLLTTASLAQLTQSLTPDN